MSEEKFECIVVGGGLAGLTAAYMLAEKGFEVLLVEKGNYSGAKNMTGGRLYGHSLEKVIPGFAKSAPLERRIVQDRLSVMSEGTITTVEYDSSALESPEGESYSVLRGTFDRWLADQAEAQGVMIVNGILVDGLLMRDGKVRGVIAGDEEMEADIVIIAEGAVSLLGQKLGYVPALLPGHATVGVKELIELNEEVINERFNIRSGEGVAWMFNGCGEVCDGFLYTNKNSISIGITMLIENIDKTEKSVPQMLEDFKNLPEIAPLLEGGKLIEYSAHLVPEVGYDMLPKLYGDGVLLAGDTAALCANMGFSLRGMDLAVESGRLAAETVIAAKEKGDFSEMTTSAYQEALEGSFVMSCMKGWESCLKLVKSGDFKNDPVDALNTVMRDAGIV